MPYRVDYSWDSRYSVKKHGSSLRRCFITLFFFALFLVSVRLFWPEGSTVLRDLVFAEDAQQVWAAFGTFASDMEQGSTLSQAVQALVSRLSAYGH